MNPPAYRQSVAARWLPWGAFALLLVLAPLVFSQGASLSILSQIGTAMILGLSCNMLLGQGGMLSFGHAVYSGLGAFCAVHAMNLAARGVFWLPVSLVPLVGGVAGMAFGALFGYVTTRKAGTTFAMITLGIVELVSASALMFPEFFGGEGGVPTNRVYGTPVFGISYGPQLQVYGLIAFWLFVAAAGMHAFTQTPLGRILNAVRDNPERAEFIGYDARRVRYLVLILSAFFAGIAGGLTAVNFEIASTESLGAARSGVVLLFTFIGGTGYFFGPMLGAALGVLLTVLLSGLTDAWQLYLGLFFMLIVVYAPGGIAGLIVAGWQIVRRTGFRRLGPGLLAAGASAAGMLLGAVAAIEMLYRLALGTTHGRTVTLAGLTLDAATPSPWMLAVALLALGGIGFQRARRVLARARDEADAASMAMSSKADA